MQQFNCKSNHNWIFGGYRYQVVPESLIPRYNGLFVRSEL